MYLFLIMIFIVVLLNMAGYHSTVSVWQFLYHNPTIGIFFGGLFLLGLSGWLYAIRLVCKVDQLSDTIDRISRGELENEIKSDSGDECARLVEAVRRMQASLIFAKKRLHHGRDDQSVIS